MEFNADKLKQLRIKKGVSRYRMSIDTKITAKDLSLLESGKTKNPRFETVESLSAYFNVNMEAFKNT